jgi:hypothetical protein
MELLDQILNVIQNSLGAQVGVIAVVLDFALRLIKSEKPLSILHGIALGLSKVGKICSAAAAFLDKVLPQRTKSE